jgi:ribosomal protein S18 acetylase RimI-like enzyme
MLESDGLVATGSSDSDARVRAVRPTERGRRERAKLDRLSDELAASILAPLDERQRAQLVQAADTVERLLLASAVELEPTDPHHPDARWCLEQYYAELAERFEGGFDLSTAIPVDAADLTPPRGVLLVGRLREQPVACGAVRDLQGFPYLKRMWVAPQVRGLGLGRRLLRELEAQAVAVGASAVRLETNRSLVEAVALYRATGYEEVPAFNDEPYAHHWFTKHL